MDSENNRTFEGSGEDTYMVRYIQRRNLQETCNPLTRLFPQNGGRDSIETELTSTIRTLHHRLPSGEFPNRDRPLHLNPSLREELTRDLVSSDEMGSDALGITPIENLPLAVRLERLKKQKSNTSSRGEIRERYVECILEKQNQIWMEDISKVENSRESLIYCPSSSEDIEDYYTVEQTEVMEDEECSLEDSLVILARSGNFAEVRNSINTLRELKDTFPPIRQNPHSLYFDALESVPSCSELSVDGGQEGSSLVNENSSNESFILGNHVELSLKTSSFESCELWSGCCSSSELSVYQELGIGVKPRGAPLTTIQEGSDTTLSVQDMQQVTAVIYRVRKPPQSQDEHVKRNLFARVALGKVAAIDYLKRVKEAILSRRNGSSQVSSSASYSEE